MELMGTGHVLSGTCGMYAERQEQHEYAKAHVAAWNALWLVTVVAWCCHGPLVWQHK
jgi:hypothetical protein